MVKHIQEEQKKNGKNKDYKKFSFKIIIYIKQIICYIYITYYMKWNIEIQHEMRLRFNNKLNFLNINNNNLLKDIYKKYNYIPDYLFIDSFLLVDLYQKYLNKMINLSKNIKNKNKDNEILEDIVKKKEDFPFDNIHFFNINDKYKTVDYLIEYQSLYIKRYFIFLNLSFYFYDENNNDISFINFNELYNIHFDDLDLLKIKEHFNKLKSGFYEEKYIHVLKKKLKLRNFNVLNSNYINQYNIKIDKNNTTSPLITFDYLKKKFKNNFNKNSNDNIIKNIISKINDDNLLKILIKNKIPRINYSFGTSILEFKTFDDSNKNYKEIVDDLMNIENIFLKIINLIPELQPFINKYGNITYHNTGSLGKTIILNNLNMGFTEIIKDYSGSFHVWITIPYNKDDSPEKFVNQHIHLANRLQLLEPIFSSYFTSPDIDSIGNNLTHSRSSLRHFLNKYSGYGTSDISLLYGSDINEINQYYLSKEDVLNNHLINVNLKDIIYDINGNIIKNYNGLDTCHFTSNNFKFLSNIKTNKNNFNINNYIIKVFKETKIRPLKNINENSFIPLGADIRATQIERLFYPELDNNYKEVIILENNKFVKYYLNIKKNIIVNKPKYNVKEYNKNLNNRTGIEFRIFDHFPTYNILQFLALCAQIVSYSMLNNKHLSKKDLYINTQLWHDEMAKTIINGFEYKINKKYYDIINKEFSINLKSNNLDLETTDFFNNFYDLMDTKLKNNSIYKKLRVDKKDFEFRNFNEYVWKYNFLLYLKNNQNKYDKLMIILKKTNNIENTKNKILELFGESFKYDINKIYHVMLSM